MAERGVVYDFPDLLFQAWFYTPRNRSLLVSALPRDNDTGSTSSFGGYGR